MRILTLIILLIPSIIQARPFIGIGAGRVHENDTIYNSFIGSGEVGYNFGLITVSGSLYHMKQNAISIWDGGNLRSGTLTLKPLVLSVTGNAHITEGLYFNFGAGGGWMFADKKLSDESVQFHKLRSEKVTEELNNDIVWQFKGGLEYFATSRVSIGGEISYFMFNTNGLFTRKRMDILRDIVYKEPFNIDLNLLVGSLKVRVYF